MADDLDFPEGLKRPPFHHLAEMFPLLPEAELNALAESIKAVGLLEPIVRKDKLILDGRNRWLACKKIGKELVEGTDIFDLGEDTDAFLYVVSKNIERRHLTAEQKREVVMALLAKYPDYSNRWIGEMAKVSHHTVQSVKEEQAKTDGAANDGARSAATPTGTKGKDGKTRKPKAQAKKDDNAERKKKVEAFKGAWKTLDTGQRRSFVREFKPELEKVFKEIEVE